MKRIALLTLALAVAFGAAAQHFPERRFIRSGNSFYEKEKFTEAEIAYRRAMEKTPESYAAKDNLAKSLYKQQRWDEAAQAFAPLGADTTHREHAAAAYYDQGNALLRQDKIDEAIEAYKKSLRINPNDQDAKFNLAYAQKKRRDQQKNDDKDKNNPDQDQNQSQPQPQPGQEQPQPAQPKEGGLSKQEAEQLLEAVQMGEDKTRRDAEEKKGKPVHVRGEKNW